MTCVVATIDGNTIQAGSDTAIGHFEEIYDMAEHKVFIRGSYLIGFCGSARVGQILQYKVELPAPPDEEDLTPFLVQEIVPRIRQAVEAEGSANEGRNFLGDKTVVLMGCRSQLWCILADTTVVETVPFAAIGSGRHHAYGALHALEAAGVEPARERLEWALGAAAEFSPMVRRPFRFYSLEA